MISKKLFSVVKNMYNSAAAALSSENINKWSHDGHNTEILKFLIKLWIIEAHTYEWIIWFYCFDWSRKSWESIMGWNTRILLVVSTQRIHTYLLTNKTNNNSQKLGSILYLPAVRGIFFKCKCCILITRCLLKIEIVLLLLSNSMIQNVGTKSSTTIQARKVTSWPF